MTVVGHLRALLFKNWLLWRRELFGSMCEILFPILLIVFMVLLRLALPSEHKSAKSYLDDLQIVGPIASYNKGLYNTTYDNYTPFKWCEQVIKYGWTYAIVDETNNANSQALMQYISTNVALKMQNHTDQLIEPKIFATMDKLEDYITDSNYDDKGHTKICFAVGINMNYPNASISIRYNFTNTDPDDQSVYGSPWDIFLTSYFTAVNKYQKSVITTYQHDFANSGFLDLQNMIYNFYIEQSQPGGYLQFGFVPMHGMKYIQDNFMSGFAGTLGFFMFITSLVPVSRLINKMTTEKETKVKEAMKMMGLTDTPYFLSWIIMYVLIFGLISALSTFIGWNLWNYSDKFLVFLMFFLYGLSCIGFCFLISSFFSKAKTAILVGVLMFFITYFTLFAVTNTTPRGTKVGLSIFNTVAMATGFYTLISLQANQVEVNFSTATDVYENYTVATALIMLTIDTIVYFLLAFYFDKVIPSEYGVALKWYFPFTKSYWMGHQANDSEFSNAELDGIKEEEEKRKRELKNNDKIEDADPDLLKQIESGQAMVVRGLRKHFGGKAAVDGLDLDIFKGQIFALLGHNGAGKTTTLSMLTGLLKPTAGTMTVNGFNFNTEMTEIRKNLGVCPQHDVLFKNLTVYEHLLMFSRFKGMTNKEEIKAAIDEKLTEVDLQDKKNTKAGNLSGGQKRKLSLSIALIGGSRIVMLDEPTSGMDLTARRRMWDMLRNDRKDRIIILTTHYMEEADILADRIAIMSEGKIHCLGSPLFLKKRFGVGYNLTINRRIEASGKEYSNQVTDIVRKYVPNFEILTEVSAETSYQLPLNASIIFSQLFKEIDKRTEDLKIENYGISVTTLEEVFIRVARGDDESVLEKRKSVKREERKDDSSALAEHTFDGSQFETDLAEARKFNIAEDRLKGILFFSHFLALIQKRVVYSWRDLKGFVLEIFLPLLLVIGGLALLTKVSVFDDQRSWKLTIDKYSTPQDVLWNFDQSDPNLSANAKEIVVHNMNHQISVSKLINDDISSSTIGSFDDDVYAERDYHPYRMGSYYFYQADNITKQFSVAIFHNTTAIQAAPTYANILGQAVAQYALGQNLKISMYNHPLPLTKKQQNLARNAGTFYVSMIFAIGMAFIPTGLVTFIVKERENNVKHQHLVSGVSIPAYWLSSYTWDLLKFMVPGILSVLMIQAFDLKSLTENSEIYTATWILFILFGVAICPHTYATSFLFKSYSIAQFYVFIYNLIMGAVAATVVWTLRLISENTRNVADGLQYIFRLASPMFCFSFGIMNVSNREAYASAYGEKVQAPLAWDIAGADVFFLGFHTVLGILLIFLIEWLGNVQWVRNIGSARDPGENQYRPDDDVENAKEVAAKTDPKEVAVKISGVRKVYGTLFGKSQVKVAIEEISFIVPFQEAFALLGVNGAGKTSTFRILTGEYGPTKGEAYINGCNVITNLSDARYNIGYCPQFDALTELLTPTEHLRLYAKIKGIPKHLVPKFVEKQLKDMGLEKYAQVRAGKLSGGNKRKLSVAIACIGNPPVVFLDEPSAGMDPEARKNMWKVINAIKSQKVSIILTTHSMDEAEALCNTIGIMVAGRLRCHGTATHIKSKFGSGYEFFLKAKYPSPEEIARDIQRVQSILPGDVIDDVNVLRALTELNCPQLYDEVSKQGSGSHIREELNEKKQVDLRTLIEWVILETYGAIIYNWLKEQFNEVSLIEHYGTSFKFRLEKGQNKSIGEIFGLIEHMKDNLNISEYSLSQTTLEQIFNMFATEGEAVVSNARLSRRVQPE